MKRLSLTIFVAVLASLLLFALAVAGVWNWTWQARAEQLEQQIAALVADPVLQAPTSDRAALGRALSRLNAESGFDLTIVDDDNRVLARAGRPIPPGRRYFGRGGGGSGGNGGTSSNSGNSNSGGANSAADDSAASPGTAVSRLDDGVARGNAVGHPGGNPAGNPGAGFGGDDGPDRGDDEGRRPRRWVASFDLPGDRSLLVRPVRAEPLPPPVGLWSGIALLVLAVALVAWPVSRRITRRLERLQRGVEQLGAGDLGARVPVEGRDEVAALARSVNASAARIEELVSTQGRLLDSQRRLLANASHELRSPLARIRLALELLLPEPAVRSEPAALAAGPGGPPGAPVAASAPDGGSAPRTDALRDEALLSVAELDRLIDEILIASRIDAARLGRGDVLGREAVDLVGLAAEEAARVGADVVVDDAAGPPGSAPPDPGGRGAAVAFAGTPGAAERPGLDLGGEVIGDSRLLRRLLRNLLENASRYHRPGPGPGPGPGLEPVTVVINRSRPDAVVVTVLDRGPGVPVAERERIFEAFYRVEGHSEGAGGVGLGLSLARQIARAHGGDLSCVGRPGGGSGFIATLSRDALAPAA